MRSGQGPSRPTRLTRHRHPGRGPVERAASLVEFALVVPLFLLLVMGIIDFSMAFNDFNSVRSGVAEGARQGVVANWAATGCTGTSSERLACLTKQRIGLDANRVKVKVDVTSTYEVGEPLRVCAMYDIDSLTGMFEPVIGNRVATAKVDMRLEKLDEDDPLTDFSETPLSGKDWSWC